MRVGTTYKTPPLRIGEWNRPRPKTQITMAIRITLSAKKGHLVFFEATFEDGIAVAGSDKMGVLALETPPTTDKEEKAILKKANSMDWTMDDEADDNGFFAVHRA